MAAAVARTNGLDCWRVQRCQNNLLPQPRLRYAGCYSGWGCCSRCMPGLRCRTWPCSAWGRCPVRSPYPASSPAGSGSRSTSPWEEGGESSNPCSLGLSRRPCRTCRRSLSLRLPLTASASLASSVGLCRRSVRRCSCTIQC